MKENPPSHLKRGSSGLKIYTPSGQCEPDKLLNISPFMTTHADQGGLVSVDYSKHLEKLYYIPNRQFKENEIFSMSVSGFQFCK